MATKVYGQSDDNIYFEGDVRGQVSQYGTDEQETGIMLIFSDGTILEVKYGKLDQGIWEVLLRVKGTLFDRIDVCMSPDEDPYSDVAHFADGLKWAYAATEWERVK